MDTSNNQKMRYQIYEAKSVKHDAQQRVGVTARNPGKPYGVRHSGVFISRFDRILAAISLKTAIFAVGKAMQAMGKIVKLDVLVVGNFCESGG